jgi:integrase
MIAAFYAMRPGEIFGLRWSSWRDEDLHIEGTAWRGTLRPGKAKTKNSKAPVAIPDMLLPLLEDWRKQNTKAPARRTFATNASGLAANAKDVQVHLRHTDIGTTFNNYTSR